MYARVMSADIPSNRRDPEKIAKVLQSSALPVIAKEKGFQGVTFFFDKQNGKLMSVTLFETEADMRQAHEGIKPARAGVLGQLGAQHVAGESFEVVAQQGKG